MPSNGFRLEFKLFLEGVEVPFKSASIASTPNGTNASINIYANKFAHDLLPKTAAQVFFREWLPGHMGEWRLMFDGFISSMTESEASTQGRMMAVECRDTIADLNKIPAALVWDPLNDLKTTASYEMAGIHRTTVTKGKNGRKDHKQDTRVYNGGGGGLGAASLIDLSESIRYVAGAAQGGITSIDKKGKPVYNKHFDPCFKYNKEGKSSGGLFLDAFARGIWMESVGGTNVAAFMNKRIRVDKKLFIPKNEAGYRMWGRQQSSSQIASYLMGNAKFSSVAASIMRIAGLFSVRMFSCATPSAIYLGTEHAAMNTMLGSKTTAVDYVIDEKVKKFMVEEHSEEYGGKYMLNEFMLLPSLEFTSPPMCNVITPPMYDNMYWTHDYDLDATRGMYKQIDMFGSAGGSELTAMNIQVPNALFNVAGTDLKGRNKLPLTLEERYKGVVPDYGSVAYKLGMDDALHALKGVLNDSAKKDLDAKIAELKIKAAKAKADVKAGLIPKELAEKIYSKLRDKMAAKSENINKLQENAVKRHAMIKFLNKRYAGRVLQVGMQFNPYVMAGFPAVIIAGKDTGDIVEMNDLIGQVQQVQHDIQITAGGADATTSIVLAGARFVSTPTDMDEDGNLIYTKATKKGANKIDPITRETRSDIFVDDSKPRVKYEEDYTIVWKKKKRTRVTVSEGEAKEKEWNMLSDLNGEIGLNLPDYSESNWANLAGKAPKEKTDADKFYEENNPPLLYEASEQYKEDEKRKKEDEKRKKEDEKAIEKDYKDRVSEWVDSNEKAMQASASARAKQAEIDRLISNGGEGYTQKVAGLAEGLSDLKCEGKVIQSEIDKLIAAGGEGYTQKVAALGQQLIDSGCNSGSIGAKPKRYKNPVVSREVYYVNVKEKVYNYSPYDMKVVSDGVDDEYKYAKDFLTMTSEDVLSGESDRMYIDSDYSPLKIHKFYRSVFGLQDDIMIGKDGSDEFVYNSIHEAVDMFKGDHPEIFNDYEKSMLLARRDICSADVFFGGVMGASVKEKVSLDDNESSMLKAFGGGTPVKYIVKKEPSDFNHKDIRDRYWGVSSVDYLTKPHKLLKKESGGLMNGPGSFSSIMENIPITPFISERREAVEEYIKSISESSTYSG